MMTTNWRQRAACRDYDPELWFPIGGPGSPRYAEQVAEAKAVCADCPVRAECLAWALEQLPIGVAGGLDEYERSALRRQRQSGGHADHRVRVAAARRAALYAGPAHQVAAQLGVCERTVTRWRQRCTS